MNPIISCSVGNASIIPGVAYSTRKNNSLTRLSFSRSSLKQGSSTRRFLFPSFVVNGVFPQNKRICSYRRKSRTSISATETEVPVEVTGSPVADEVSSESPSVEVAKSVDSSPKSDTNTSSAKVKRSRPGRKSDMPPVKIEELIPGASFTGKVKSIQPFGAFVDIGAFTDGLVHISMLSDNYVKDIASVVSVGQEVKVKLIEVNSETKRISLSMRESADTGKRNDAPNTRDPSRSGPRKDSVNKQTKFSVGQELKGKVKNKTRSGTFISLPEGEEGFLPLGEESKDGSANIMGKSSLEAGQEVSVRVLRITKGRATLTMKKKGAVEEWDKPLLEIGNVGLVSNPFAVAFRKNKDIAKFLDEREKVQSEAKSSTTKTEEDVGSSSSVGSSTTVADDESSQGSIINGDIEKETEEASANLASEEDISVVNPIIEEAIQTDITTSDVEIDSPVEATDENVTESGVDQVVAEDEKQSETDNEKEVVAATQTDSDAVEPVPVTETDITSSAPELPEETEVDDNVVAVPENNESDLSPEGSLSKDGTEENIQIPSPESPATEEVLEEQTLVTAQVESPATEEVQEEQPLVVAQVESPATEEVQEEQTPVAAQVEEVAIGSETNSTLSSSNEQTDITASDEGLSKAAISPVLVKQLRDETGAGMMDCKNALSESEGDITKAQELLRKKGLASADKKAARATAEGRIGSYIHDSRIGVLVEVNCETDFVSRGEIFKELVEDIAMQVAACPQVEYITTEDVPEEIVSKEKEIEMQKEDLASKPEQIRSRIVEGRIRKRLEDLALLEQPYIKNDKVPIKDWVKQTIATIGENIKVTRFVRFNLGEGLEKRSQDFAAEVAAQTTAKPVTTPVKEEPAAAEVKEIEPKKSTVTISASLVKQLREETGAGMMDCKKALAETEGDLEKAQAYLRKKGLSSADKKSGRLAAEGRIGTYIHDSRIGVLIEVNCETDFVGRSEKFKELVDDLAMQVVACPQVQFVSIEDIPEATVKKEKELEMQREDLASKPENIREKIVEGRISKRLGELALLEQSFIKDDSVLVKDLVKQSIAAIGENIKVRRFVRFTLGETVEKETTVAA
ncbi:polyprotein of EF-Ts, chloroplastic-like isoform X1 [Vicia villosa]|uniref:polyprotein of EF-Ts, chloroplastic-like isoform X1 n=1 Tax=Vicia villosa TaxID=3911 RepID=UPI00273C2AE4|nr:polyprotein of EF-Ts, chloroplastic-like isoform X1 [Vicia villosa]